MVTRIVTPDQAQNIVRQVGKSTRGAARAVQKNIGKVVAGTLGLSGERMSRVDTAWLRMDGASNLMMIVGVWVLEPGITHAALCQRIEERLLKYDRFRQRVVEDAAGATWVEDPEFDIARHVVVEKLPRRAKGQQQEALQQRVGDLAMQPLARRHPLWQFHLVENYTTANGQPGSAMIVRIHHCIADGIALIQVMNSLVDGGAAPKGRGKRQAISGAEDWLAEAVLKPVSRLTVKALGMAGDGASRSMHWLSHPQEGVSGSIDMAKVGLHMLSDLAALALMADDSRTRLKGKAGTQKRVAWCPPIPLDEVKAVGKALNASVNDVLLSCVAGAIGEYLRSKGDDPAGQEIRAMVPVNLRPQGQVLTLGNRFGLAPLVLPIGVANPVERIYEVRRRMALMKDSFQPLLAFSLLAVAGLLIKPAQDAMLNLFNKKTTAVMTNVPGPREKMQFLGATLTENMFWVPQSGDVGLGVSILSYGGGVQFGVITDSTLCPDPQAIIDEFAPEFAKLSLLTLMLPWE